MNHYVLLLVYSLVYISVGAVLFFNIKSINCPIWQMPAGFAGMMVGWIIMFIPLKHFIPEYHAGVILWATTTLALVYIVADFFFGFKFKFFSRQQRPMPPFTMSNFEERHAKRLRKSGYSYRNSARRPWY